MLPWSTSIAASSRVAAFALVYALTGDLAVVFVGAALAMGWAVEELISGAVVQAMIRRARAQREAREGKRPTLALVPKHPETARRRAHTARQQARTARAHRLRKAPTVAAFHPGMTPDAVEQEFAALGAWMAEQAPRFVEDPDQPGHLAVVLPDDPADRIDAEYEDA